jgi:hypothetical protein
MIEWCTSEDEANFISVRSGGSPANTSDNRNLGQSGARRLVHHAGEVAVPRPHVLQPHGRGVVIAGWLYPLRARDLDQQYGLREWRSHFRYWGSLSRRGDTPFECTRTVSFLI